MLFFPPHVSFLCDDFIKAAEIRKHTIFTLGVMIFSFFTNTALRSKYYIPNCADLQYLLRAPIQMHAEQQVPAQCISCAETLGSTA